MGASLASTVISSAVSSATKVHLTATDAQKATPLYSTMEETEELRRAYLEIIESDDWKQQMENAAIQITHDLTKDLQQKPFDNTKFTVAHHGLLYEFDSDVNKFIMIGRKHGCDIEFNEGPGSSRLHALLMPLPQLGIYLVVDMGGLFGIITEKRSNSNVCTCSVPKLRNVIVLDWNEISVLKLGSERIAINPKECVICFERPRTMTFNCGHHTTCDYCTIQVHECPVCRQPITGAKKGYMFQTNVATNSNN
jgi:hypothetical protein